MKDRYQGEDRRTNSDPRIDVLVHGYEELKKEMAANTAITNDIRDILGTFRILGSVAKWITAIAAAITAGYHGFIFWRNSA